ncbi:MAG: hypothetical protein K2N11_10410 [Mucispirillum sp.]|nr:hypothetical protein [Mucispirillum sp.]
MKITVNYISNVFLAVILALLPYTALIKIFIKNNDTPFLTFDMVSIVVLNIIVYISAVTGLEIAENKAGEKGLKTHLTSALFILLVLPVILKYIIGMMISVVPELVHYNITMADDIILIIYVIILLTVFFRYSAKAAYCLAPLLVYYIFSM